MTLLSEADAKKYNFSELLAQESNLTHLPPQIKQLESELIARYTGPKISPQLVECLEMGILNKLAVQTDDYSCTKVSVVNALRFLDRPNDSYTEDWINKALIKAGIGKTPYINWQTARDIFQQPPYDQFSELWHRNHSKSYEEQLALYINYLGQGLIGTLGLPFDSTQITAGHARTIFGVTITDNYDNLVLGVSDPYFPYRPQFWKLDDILSAITLYRYHNFDRPPKFNLRDTLRHLTSAHTMIIKKNED